MPEKLTTGSAGLYFFPNRIYSVYFFNKEERRYSF